MINNIKKNELLILFLYTLIALCFHYFDNLFILKYTFKPFETFFHEIGHGFTSMLFGGEVVNIHLEYNQGYVTHKTRDIFQPIVSFMGYTSASFFGFLIYISSIVMSKITRILLILVSSFWIIYSDNLMTFIILLFIIFTFCFSWYIKEYGEKLIKFIGVYIMISSIYSPTYLWAYNDKGDHISLSESLFLPSFIFIIIWFFIGLLFMFLSFKFTKKIE